ncbi:ArdC-like ssDNA-binding domain-containing protein [Luteococcus peritonei]|uniref:ArdC-like ssDNA-binding domain-containing protein n=1 Tax=Luteococcus peritonei TaxID=88874 RepID=A0ABW4RWE7_9ACTN
MARRPPTEAQKAERAEQLEHLQAQIADKVADLTSSEQWQAWLRVATRFHQYSFNNTILIWTQRPDATLVAGYTTWQKSFHRQVNRGEQGIRILAPVTRRVPKLKPDDTPVLDDKGKPVMATQIVGVKPTSVFDISQTTGDPVPEPPRPALLTGRAPEGLWQSLASLVHAQGFRLERGDCRGANGYTDYTTRTVKVRDDVDDAQAVKTLAHELGHVLLHQPTTDAAPVCRDRREVEAESVAYLVTAAHGLDSSQYTFTYVAGWAEQALPHHKEGTTIADVIHITGTRVLKTAHQILDATSAPDNTPTIGQALAETVARNVAADRTAMLPDGPAPRWDSGTRRSSDPPARLRCSGHPSVASPAAPRL